MRTRKLEKLISIQDWTTPRKNVCACVNITEICIVNAMSSWCQVFRMLSKTQNGSDFDVLPFLWKCKRNNERNNPKTRNNYSPHIQEVVLCKKINQRWLSINLLYKTFFNCTTQIYKFCINCINFV
jgi:hypothetical protein